MAVADLIPGDLILPGPAVVAAGEVVGYPHGVQGMSGTLVSISEGGVVINRYYSNTETVVNIFRSA